MFHDKVHLQHGVKRWAFSEKKPFKVVISNPRTYDVKCLSLGCPWRVHGFLPKGESDFVVSIIVGHSCKLTEMVVKHKNMTTEFVANAARGTGRGEAQERERSDPEKDGGGGTLGGGRT
jgi:uncharacterized membrane protein YgcG